jgi:hypothetical protein
LHGHTWLLHRRQCRGEELVVGWPFLLQIWTHYNSIELKQRHGRRMFFMSLKHGWRRGQMCTNRSSIEALPLTHNLAIDKLCTRNLWKGLVGVTQRNMGIISFSSSHDTYIKDDMVFPMFRHGLPQTQRFSQSRSSSYSFENYRDLKLSGYILWRN